MADVPPIVNVIEPTPKEDTAETTVVQDSRPRCTERPFGGPFVMHRRPVEYFIYRPSDEEYLQNKIQAYWKLVRNASRYWYQRRHLSWKAISERRDKRKLYHELLWKEEKNGTLTDDETAKWVEVGPQCPSGRPSHVESTLQV